MTAIESRASPLTSVYKCPDGTDFPVTWEQPDDVQKKWLWGQEHQPDPMKPLESAIGKLTRPGAQRAFTEAQVPTPPLFRGGRIANGFVFSSTDTPTPEEQNENREAVERLIEREGGVWEVWERFCLPRIEAACARLRGAQEREPLASLAELYGYGMRVTHVAGSFTLFASVIQQFSEFGDESGLDGDRLFADLTPGYANATLKANAALWELAEIAGASATVRTTLQEADPDGLWDAICALPDAGEFVTAFEAYLDRYGWRAAYWTLSSPTWRECPSTPLTLVRRILEERPAPPGETLREGAARREAVMREIEGRLKDDPAGVDDFHKLAEPLAHYIPIREARAHWQLTLTGVMRTVLLQKGRPLVQRGFLAKVDDVFYLLPEEIESALTGDGADLLPRVEERKAEWEFWSQRRPPESIGSEPGTTSSGAPDAGDGLIRGLAASRGVVTARARVLLNISDAHRLQPGEVLVCAMSSPPWTPLFSIAAAVVTDSGGILSHPAIVAREYGIPCVVGTRVGTQAIRDGDMITVDGTQGTVRIELE